MTLAMLPWFFVEIAAGHDAVIIRIEYRFFVLLHTTKLLNR